MSAASFSWSSIFNWLLRNAFVREDRWAGGVTIRCECCSSHWARLTDGPDKGRAAARADRRVAAVHVVRYHSMRVAQVDNDRLLRAQQEAAAGALSGAPVPAGAGA